LKWLRLSTYLDSPLHYIPFVIHRLARGGIFSNFDQSLDILDVEIAQVLQYSGLNRRILDVGAIASLGW
jgi:hypothetical protein